MLEHNFWCFPNMQNIKSKKIKKERKKERMRLEPFLFLVFHRLRHVNGKNRQNSYKKSYNCIKAMLL